FKPSPSERIGIAATDIEVAGARKSMIPSKNGTREDSDFDVPFAHNEVVERRAHQSHQSLQNPLRSNEYELGPTGARADGRLEDRVRCALFRVSRQFKAQGNLSPSQSEVDAAVQHIEAVSKSGLGPSEIRLVILEGIDNAKSGIDEGPLAEALAT